MHEDYRYYSLMNVYGMGRKALAQRLSLLSQAHDSPGSTTVEVLVRHGRYPHRDFLEALSEADRAAVDRAIELAGIDHLRDNEVANLSGGQKQLV